MSITATVQGDWRKTMGWLQKAQNGTLVSHLDAFGRMGVEALAAHTPLDSGRTASSWSYEITSKGKSSFTISWTNSNVNNGVPIAILIQYGHGQHQGGFVQGRDYINPAMQPVFDRIASDIWRQVSR